MKEMARTMTGTTMKTKNKKMPRFRQNEGSCSPAGSSSFFSASAGSSPTRDPIARAGLTFGTMRVRRVR